MKRLYRSSSNKRLAGVCGGLEEFTDIDSTIWRLIFIALAIPGGVPGILLYIIMWLVVPEKGNDPVIKL